MAQLHILSSDTYSFTTAGIPIQHNSVWFLRAVYHVSKLCSMAKQSYDIYVWNLWAVTHSATQWCKYCKGVRHINFLQRSCKNMEYFKRSNVVFQRQVRWRKIPSSHNLVVEHLEGTQSPMERPSGEWDKVIRYDRPTARCLFSLVATSIDKSWDDLVRDIKEPQETYHWSTEMRPGLTNASSANESQQR